MSGRSERTQVGIVGSGPAGLLLSQLLHRSGIESVVLERHSRAHVEGRVRAGVLEQGTVDLLAEAGVGDRLAREALVHEGVRIALEGRARRIPFRELAGRGVTVYGQAEVTKDLIAARLDAGATIVFEAAGVEPLELDTARPRLRWTHDGEHREVACDFVAGCDGFHGVCRARVPPARLTTYERTYPFAWLGMLVEAPPIDEELLYSRSTRGFSLCSMRTPSISRHYLQCPPQTDADAWSGDRFFEELRRRLGPELSATLRDGPVLERTVAPVRAFVAEPMRHGRLFLAGDAAHIVPPTGAKGLNLAASDVHYLHRALVAYYENGDEAALDAYSDTALARVWKAQRFSWRMTEMLHVFPDERAFESRIHRAELDHVLSSHAALASLAENYVGLPL